MVRQTTTPPASGGRDDARFAGRDVLPSKASLSLGLVGVFALRAWRARRAAYEDVEARPRGDLRGGGGSSPSRSGGSPSRSPFRSFGGSPFQGRGGSPFRDRGDREGGGAYSQQQASEAKRERETYQFQSYQERLLSRGAPPVDEDYWRRQERNLFKTAHVTQGINFQRYDDIPVDRVGGQGTEMPIESFQEAVEKFELPSDLAANFERCGYSAPTPVQKHSIPAALAGTDVMVSAQTGSGKTAAFLVPIISTALRAPPSELKPGPIMPSAVVLAPTRELCQQITAEARRLTFRTNCRVVSIYGGADALSQLKELAEGCDVAICTPGRLEDFLDRGVISVEAVRYLALDEADRMLDMGFEPQIRAIVEGHNMPEPGGGGDEGRQTMMFSATFPTEMQDLALDFLDPAYLWIGVGRVGSAASDVEQRFEDTSRADDEEKLDKLVDALEGVKNPEGQTAKSIVFANKKAVVDDLVWRLQDARIRAAPIHGGLTQAQRDRAIGDLKAGHINVLVATDVAARGLDLPGIDHVVNYDLPMNSEDYVHRVGRTGRIGNTGVATSFVGRNEQALPEIVKAMQAAQQEDENAAPVPAWVEHKVKTSRGPVRSYYSRKSAAGRGMPRSASPSRVRW